jgi:hypothetical protein
MYSVRRSTPPISRNWKIAWRFKTDNLGTRPEFNLQATPLVIGSMRDSTSGTNWPGRSFEPATNTLYVYSGTDLFSIELVRHGLHQGRGAHVKSAGNRPALSQLGLSVTGYFRSQATVAPNHRGRPKYRHHRRAHR